MNFTFYLYHLTQNFGPNVILSYLKTSFTLSIIYCRDDIKRDSLSPDII